MTLENESELLRKSGRKINQDKRCFVVVVVVLDMEVIQWTSSRCGRAADRGPAGGAGPGAASDVGVWPRVRLQSPAEHRHAERGQHGTQADRELIGGGS